MRKTNKIALIAVFGIVTLSSAMAEEAPAANDTSIALELDRNAEEMALAKRRIDLLEYRKKLAEASGSSGGISEQPLRVKAIESFGGKSLAVCLAATGETITRSIGDEISGWKIVNIQGREVVFSKNKKTVRVPVSFGGSTSTSIAGQPGQPARPGMPAIN